MSQDTDFSIGDSYEGVLLETCRDEKRSVTRPRVRPLEYFPSGMRVEFPRDLREEFPIGTRFRADVTVGQKHWGGSGAEKGPRYLIARPSSIVREVGYTPEPRIMAVRKPGTISGRAHDYEIVEAVETTVSIFDLRDQAYLFVDMEPSKTRREEWQRTRNVMITQYAQCRSRGHCEGCKNPAPFMRRNGEPYLEVHHIQALADGGADHPLNVAAVCPNCHSRVTHGKDAGEYNAIIADNVRAIETQLQSDSP